MSAEKGKTGKAKKTMQLWKLYNKGVARNRNCPKCGSGVFMAQHKDRVSCGKCGYTEFSMEK